MSALTVEIRTDVVEFIRLGDRVCNDYRVHLPNRATFDAAMTIALGCNSFNPTNVARTFRGLFGDVMHVEFGAEGSPVLYVTLPFWSHQRMDTKTFGMGEQYSAEQRQELAQRVIDWARSMKADEICTYQHPHADDPVQDKPGDNPYRIRIWWD